MSEGSPGHAGTRAPGASPTGENVALHLHRAAARRPDVDAIIAPLGDGWRRITFAELDRWTSRLASGLRARGIGKGTRTLLLVKAGIDLIGVTYALFKAGAVPVLIDPGMGRAAFLRCVADLAPEAFVGIPLGHVARLLNPSTFRTVRTHVTVGTRWLWGGDTLETLEAAGDPDFVCEEVAGDDEAAVLFTSGSTGPAKGVVYTHGMFNAQVRELRDIYGFAPGEVDCAAFPLFSLFDNALEMTSVIPDLDPSKPGTCDPAKVARALTEHACTTAFGSPAIWRRVAPWATSTGARFPLVRRILIAGAPVPPALIRELHTLLPAGEVGTPYGATESLPVANMWGREILAETAARTQEGAGTCVGRPAPGITVRILAVTDTPLARLSEASEVPRGTVGEICVRGDVVTRLYANRAEATAAAKIVDDLDPAFPGAIWHRMGDVGYLDDTGRLWFCGRKAERVVTATGPLYTDCIEGRLSPLTAGRRVALVGKGPAGAEEPWAYVEGATDPAIEAAVRASGLVVGVRFLDHFPTDVRHNAKIQRGVLKAALDTT